MSLQHVRRFLAATLLAGLALPLSAIALAAQTGTIFGKVTDTASGKPLENAQVQVQPATGSSYGAVSGVDGSYRALNVPAGPYTVTARLIGYLPRTFFGTRVTAGGTTTLDIGLTARAVELNQTVVTASRNVPEKALDAPASISVISSEKIEEKPAVTVADHLGSTPGISIIKGGIAQSNIVARGFNNAFSGSMLMLQDYRFAGVPSLRVNVPFLFTGTNEDVERIEVLLGPASALYGPNSANGVLHVITKSPFNSAGTTVSLDGGERSVLRGGLRHAGILNEKFAYKLSGEYMRGKDWEYNDLAEGKTFGTTFAPVGRAGTANNRDFDLERMSGEARMDIRPQTGMELISTVGMTKLGKGIELTGANGSAQAKNWTYLNLQQRFVWNRLFAQVFLNSSNAGNDTLTSTDGTYLLRSGAPIVDKSRVFGAQLQHGLTLADGKQSFTYGADYIWTNPRTGHTINGSNEDVDNVTEYGAYIQSSTKPNKWSELLLAARGDGNNVIKGSFFSPRAALIFKPTETQNVRFTYNRAFSTPANFSFFLDLINTPNIGGSGYDLKALGNPPKTGFTYRHGCAGAALGDFCMKSKYVNGGEFTAASAASVYPVLIAGNAAAFTAAVRASITPTLQQVGFSAQQIAGVASGIVGALGAARPTDAQLGTRVSLINNATKPLTAADLGPISPLAASFNNTYEIGYKGIIANRFRYDISGWRQQRGDVGTSAALSTPNVFFGGSQLGQFVGGTTGAYLAQSLAPTLIQAGVPAATVNAIVTGIASGVGTSVATTIAPAPLGVVTFDRTNSKATEIYAVYRNVDKKLWISGLDMALDFAATDLLTFSGTYSYQNRNVFKGIEGGNGAPLMSNSPRNRASVGSRMSSGQGGWGGELTVRYSDAFPVNSGVYASNVAFPIAAGQPGAVTAVAPGVLGYNKCPVVAGSGAFCYEGVPTAFLLDAQVTKKFDLGKQRFMVSVNATNVLDNKVRSFVGVPEIGRLVLTRLQYTF
jgi:outer membrane receptor for ferrienterochelin and colicins